MYLWQLRPLIVQALPLLCSLCPAGQMQWLWSSATLKSSGRYSRIFCGSDLPTASRTKMKSMKSVIRGRDLRGVVREMQRAVAEQVDLPPGYSVSWSGQFEFLERAAAQLKLVMPFTLLIIFVLLYLTFRRFDEALLIMTTLPLALVGGVWLLWALGHNLSVASAVGFIPLAGVAAEFGVIILLYLKQSWAAREAAGQVTDADLLDAIREGAVLRVRPKAMTVAVIVAGLLPLFWGDGTGSEVMQRIAAPMVGGMISAPLLSMLVIPAVYRLMRRSRR